MIPQKKNVWFIAFFAFVIIGVGMVSFLPAAHAEPEHNTLIVGLFYLVREPIDFVAGIVTDTFCALGG